MTFVLALCLVFLLFPLIAMIAALSWLSGMRQVFYCDQRVGQGGRLFTMWKFRTMRDLAEGQARDAFDKARVTRLGLWLRRYRLDELPQLYNVLKGDLNLVGMRPPLPSYVRDHPQVYAGLLEARPGLTGLASVRFHQREDALMAAAPSAQAAKAVHAKHCLPVKARLDRFYLTRRSLWLDCWILVQTLCVFLPNSGVLGVQGPKAIGRETRASALPALS